MKDFFSSFSNRTKAIYLSWIFINFFLLMNEGFGKYEYSYGIFPISSENYNLYSFIFYTLAPIFIVIIFRLWRTDEKEIPVKDSLSEKESEFTSPLKTSEQIAKQQIHLKQDLITPNNNLQEILIQKSGLNIKNLESKDILFFRITLITLLVIFSLLLVIPQSNSNDILYIIGQFLEGLLFLGFIPMIIALLRKLLKKKPSLSIYVIYMFIISSIFFFLYSGMNFLMMLSEKLAEITKNFNSYLLIVFALASIFLITIFWLWRRDKKKTKNDIRPVRKSDSIDAISNSSISDLDDTTAETIISQNGSLEQSKSLSDHQTKSEKISNITEPKIKSEESKNITRLRIAMVILSIGLSIIYNIPNIGNHPLDLIIARILGGAIGLGIIPGIIGFIRMSMKKKPSLNITAIYSLIILVSFLLAYSGMNSQVLFSDKLTERTENYKTKEKPVDFFSSEYFISFPSPYSERDKYTSFNGGVLKSFTAEVVINKSLLRAEYAYLDTSFIKRVNRIYAIKMLNEYARHQGLQYATSEYNEGHLGKMAKVRGYKTLVDDYGSDIKMTFEMTTHYGNSSMMIIYVGSSSQNFPTPEIISFINSLKKL